MSQIDVFFPTIEEAWRNQCSLLSIIAFVSQPACRQQKLCMRANQPPIINIFKVLACAPTALISRVISRIVLVTFDEPVMTNGVVPEILIFRECLGKAFRQDNVPKSGHSCNAAATDRASSFEVCTPRAEFHSHQKFHFFIFIFV